MSNDLEQSYTDIKKKRILSILTPNLEMNSIASCKLYTSGVEGKKWLYSDLDGLLCFVLDYQFKTRFLVLYDSFSFEKLFQYEIYADFGKAFLKLTDDFRAFEVDNGFIGLQFDFVSEANQFDIIIKKFEGNFLKSLFESKPFSKKIDITDKMKSYARTLKDLFCSGEDYDENYAEDGTEISKARCFEMLNNISYNKEAKQFEIGEISEELRKIFIAAGLRKKDLKNDLDFAFQMFKQIILGVSENKDLLYTDYFHKQYSPPESKDNNKNDSNDDDDDDDDEDNNTTNGSNSTSTQIKSQKQIKQSLTSSIKPQLNKQTNASVNNSIKPPVTQSNIKSNTNDNLRSSLLNSNNNKSSTNTRPTPTQINQNKQIKATIQPPKQVGPTMETKPVNKVTQPPLQSNPSGNKPKFEFQPPKQSTSINQSKPTPNPVTQPPKKVVPPLTQNTLGVPQAYSPPVGNTNAESTTSSIPTPPALNIPTPPPFTIPTPPPLNIPTPPPFNAPTPPQGQNIPQPPLNIPMPPPFSLDLSMLNIPVVEEDNTQKSREDELTSIKLKKVSVEETTKAPSMYDQIKSIKLKAVTKKETAPIITKNEKNYLQSSLAAAIQQRRKNIMKHQEENDSEDEDW